MRDHYDFSNARPNPYIDLLAEKVELRITKDALRTFRRLSEEWGIPFETLMVHALSEAAEREAAKPHPDEREAIEGAPAA